MKLGLTYYISKKDMNIAYLHKVRFIFLRVLPHMSVCTWYNSYICDGLYYIYVYRHRDVICYEVAPHAKIAHPEAEHFYPLLVALGSAGEAAKAELIHHSWGAGCLSMASYRFSNNPWMP